MTQTPKSDDFPTALIRQLGELFGETGEPRLALAPGRVNLIGEHTDYNDGWALPMAIDRHVAVAFSARDDRRIRAHAVAFDETREVDLDAVRLTGQRSWTIYLAGLAWAMMDSGLEVRGMDCVIDGNVPIGAGLSSSAAFEMAAARALCEVSKIPWSPPSMAVLGRGAENRYVGVSCGVMDQMISSCAREGCALLLDCRTLETEAVRLPETAAIVVMDSGSRRSLADSEYNERRSSCARALEILGGPAPGLTALRDVDAERLESARDRMPERVFRRARHVVEENLRPRALAAALGSGDLAEAGRLMDASHASLRDLYEVSSPELDRITELARAHPACFGARLTGAGFGGYAVALVEAGGAEAFLADVGRQATAEPGLGDELFACHPVAGARLW